MTAFFSILIDLSVIVVEFVLFETLLLANSESYLVESTSNPTLARAEPFLADSLSVRFDLVSLFIFVPVASFLMSSKTF